MKYQALTVVPWWIKRYIFRRKGLTTPVLYRFEDDTPEARRDEESPREDSDITTPNEQNKEILEKHS